MDKIQYWFNTKTGKVEQGPQSLSLDRIGPFESEEEARSAPLLIAERARRIREEDQRQDNWD